MFRLPQYSHCCFTVIPASKYFLERHILVFPVSSGPLSGVTVSGTPSYRFDKSFLRGLKLITEWPAWATEVVTSIFQANSFSVVISEPSVLRDYSSSKVKLSTPLTVFTSPAFSFWGRISCMIYPVHIKFKPLMRCVFSPTELSGCLS